MPVGPTSPLELALLRRRGLVPAASGSDSPLELGYAPAMKTESSDYDLIGALATHCVEDVAGAVGMDLDYSAETLPIVDHHCKSLDRNPSELDRLHRIALMVGAYFGEVVRRKFGGRWHADPKRPEAWRVELESCFLYFNPVGQAMELLFEGDVEGWNADFTTWPEAIQALVPVFDSMPAMRSTDFYTLSTRLEVLETIVHFLMINRRAEDPEKFDSAFYSEAIARLHPEAG